MSHARSAAPSAPAFRQAPAVRPPPTRGVFDSDDEDAGTYGRGCGSSGASYSAAYDADGHHACGDAYGDDGAYGDGGGARANADIYGGAYGDAYGSGVQSYAASCGTAPVSQARIEASAEQPPPFLPDGAINAKVFLWEGDPSSLEVDALLAPSATGYAAGASTVFAKVLRYGGRDLRHQLRTIEPCRSGEARIAKAYGLPCHRLLLTVGPKYKDKYQMAAQNTLNACYRECFQLLVEADLRTVGIPCLWYNNGFPLVEQAHVALRSVRKCLDNLRQRVDAVVLASGNSEQTELYQSLMPLYFPRTEVESYDGLANLPMLDSCRSQWGEVAVDERKIRVSNLITRDDRDSDRDDDLAQVFTEGDRVCGDADARLARRLDSTMIEAENIEQAGQACIRYLRRAHDFRPEPECSRWVYRGGQDRYARHVVFLLGARWPSLGVRDERTLPLFVKELESLRGERFVLLYVNSCVDALDSSKLEVLQEVLAVIGARYRNTLDQILVLHSGMWFRAAFALGRTMGYDSANVWNDLVYLDTINDLGGYVAHEQIQLLPDYVRQWECAGG